MDGYICFIPAPQHLFASLIFCCRNHCWNSRRWPAQFCQGCRWHPAPYGHGKFMANSNKRLLAHILDILGQDQFSLTALAGRTSPHTLFTFKEILKSKRVLPVHFLMPVHLSKFWRLVSLVVFTFQQYLENYLVRQYTTMAFCLKNGTFGLASWCPHLQRTGDRPHRPDIHEAILIWSLVVKVWWTPCNAVILLQFKIKYLKGCLEFRSWSHYISAYQI